MKNEKLGLVALVAIVVSSMIGSGVDSLPQNMAAQSAIAPVVIAWLVCGMGMYCIAQTFVRLSQLRPDLDSGVYMYARTGFGPLAAFLAGWGYWLMTICSNVAFAVMVMDTLNYFVPGAFKGGNNISSIIGASALIWGFNALVLSGTKVAGGINAFGTFAKMVPLVIFVGVLVYFFDAELISSDVWGRQATPVLGPLPSQVLAPLFVAMWCFIGVEGAVALSGRAQNKQDIGRATMIGFVLSLVICILVSVLPFAVLSQHQLSTIPNPSTAGVMKAVVGEWGEVIINLGVLISILASWLAWTMICAEIPMVAARDGTLPKWFAKRNDKGAAASSLWASSAMMQLAVLAAYFASNAWLAMLAISSIMVLPAYFLSALYLLKISLKDKIDIVTVVVGCIGAVFCVFMLYASDARYIAMAPLLLTAGLPLYLISVYNPASPLRSFSRPEYAVIAGLLIVDIWMIYLFSTDAFGATTS